MVTTVANMDNQLNPTEMLKSISASVVRTDEYKDRYQRFQKYLGHYHPEDPEDPEDPESNVT